jgi:hypothetical protein
MLSVFASNVWHFSSWACKEIEMKRLIPLIVISFFVFPCSQVFANSCGPFGLIKGSSYCLKCPEKNPRKVKNCPGGEVGRVAVGVANPNCQVSFYNKYCLAHAPASVDLDQDEYTGNVKDGEASVIPDGEYYVIKMTKGDFEKLIYSSPGAGIQNDSASPSTDTERPSSKTDAKTKK